MNKDTQDQKTARREPLAFVNRLLDLDFDSLLEDPDFDLNYYSEEHLLSA